MQKQASSYRPLLYPKQPKVIMLTASMCEEIDMIIKIILMQFLFYQSLVLDETFHTWLFDFGVFLCIIITIWIVQFYSGQHYINPFNDKIKHIK